MPAPRQIGRTLKRARERRAHPDRARVEAGVSRAYVFRLEAGGADPTVGLLQKLAKALGVPLITLLKSPTRNGPARCPPPGLAHHSEPVKEPTVMSTASISGYTHRPITTLFPRMKPRTTRR